MKLRNNFLAAALLAAVSPMAMAQSTGDISIGGTLVPGACTITLAGGGIVDYGQIDTAALNASNQTAIGAHTVAADIVCSGPTVIVMSAFDNRLATLHPLHTGANQFGLGLTNGTTGNAIGYFAMTMNSPMLNGGPATMIQSVDLMTWSALGAQGWEKNNVATNSRYRAFGTAAGGPVAVTTASVNVVVGSIVNALGILQVTQDATLDGSATIELTYI